MLGTVARLRRYPVKSMLGEDLDASDVSPRGLARHNRVTPLAGLDPEPCAGVYAEVLYPGRIRVGNAVRVTAASRAPAR